MLILHSLQMTAALQRLMDETCQLEMYYKTFCSCLFAIKSNSTVTDMLSQIQTKLETEPKLTLNRTLTVHFELLLSRV